MNLNEYQALAKGFAIYPMGEALVYPALGLASEAGEVAGKIKKWIRDGKLSKEAVVSELGDVLWYVALCASDVGSTLDEVAATNLDKLTQRKANGTIKGEGDDR